MSMTLTYHQTARPFPGAACTAFAEVTPTPGEASSMPERRITCLRNMNPFAICGSEVAIVSFLYHVKEQ